jgi:hypothetical protein
MVYIMADVQGTLKILLHRDLRSTETRYSNHLILIPFFHLFCLNHLQAQQEMFLG